MAKSYCQYIAVASAQILLRRGKCSHPQNWQNEETLYHRCHGCGAFLPFRNPFDIKVKGEFGQGTPNEIVSLGGIVVHTCVSNPDELL